MRNGPVRVSQCRHGWMQYFETDRYVGRSLDLYGEFSEGETELFRQLIKPGDTVVDAGANIGAFTLVFSRLVGDAGLVFAVEPQRQLYLQLCGTMALNMISNVLPSCMALGVRQAQVVVPWFDLREAGNVSGLELGRHKEGELVPIVPLDALQVGERGVQFIKADVEGMERQLLEGGEALISKCKPILYVENDRGDKSKPLIQWLTDHGYRMWWHATPLYQPDNWRKHHQNVFPNVISVNMLCVPEDKSSPVDGLKLKRAEFFRPVRGADDWWETGRMTVIELTKRALAGAA